MAATTARLREESEALEIGFLKFSDGFRERERERERERDLARLTVCLTIVKFTGLSD